MTYPYPYSLSFALLIPVFDKPAFIFPISITTKLKLYEGIRLGKESQVACQITDRLTDH